MDKNKSIICHYRNSINSDVKFLKTKGKEEIQENKKATS